MQPFAVNMEVCEVSRTVWQSVECKFFILCTWLNQCQEAINHPNCQLQSLQNVEVSEEAELICHCFEIASHLQILS